MKKALPTNRHELLSKHRIILIFILNFIILDIKEILHEKSIKIHIFFFKNLLSIFKGISFLVIWLSTSILGYLQPY